MSEENKEPEAVEEEVKREEKPFLKPYEMEMSENINELVGALAKAQGVIKNGVKNREGHQYKYVELSQIIDIAKEPLAKNDLAVIQTHELDKNGTPSVITTTLLAHSSGQWIKSRLEMPITPSKMLSRAQLVGVAATYARRYAYQAMLGIAGEDDTDGRS